MRSLIAAASLLVLAACAHAQNAAPLAPAGAPKGIVGVTGPAGGTSQATFIAPAGAPPDRGAPSAPPPPPPVPPAPPPPPPTVEFPPLPAPVVATNPNPPYTIPLGPGMNLDNVLGTSVRYAPPTAGNLSQMYAMGMRTVRIPFDPAYMAPGLLQGNGQGISTPTTVATHMAQLDLIMQQVTTAGFNMILVPIPQATQTALSDPASQALILAGITGFAAHVSTLGYTTSQLYVDVLNEPHYTTDVWNTFLPQVMAAYRTYLPNTTLLIPPAKSDVVTNLQYLNIPSDTNVIFEVHLYEPAELTSQASGVGYPQDLSYLFPCPVGCTGPTGGAHTEWTYTDLSNYLLIAIQWAILHNVPIMATEFGATNNSDPASRKRWVLAMRSTLEANHIPWLWWSLDGRLFGLRLRLPTIKGQPFNPSGGPFDTTLVPLLTTPYVP